MEQILFTTGIPNDFIDIHLPVAKPLYAVVYIYGYRQFSKGEKNICCKAMAEIFDTSFERIHSIWEYWQNLGLVEITPAGDALEVTFLNSPNTKKPMPKQAAPITPHDYEKFSLEEVESKLNDPAIARLLFVVQHVTGGPLTDTERRMYLSFYDYYGLPVDVISVLLEHCVAAGKLHGNYLRQVAADWSEKQLFTVEAAEEYIRLFNGEYRQILRYMGISGRDPIDKEIELMVKWLKEDGLSMDVIRLACEKTVINKGKAYFPYTDGIIEKWKADNIRTAAQVKALEPDYYDNIKSARRTKKRDKARFQNYTGRKWDYDALAKMNQDYLDRKVAE